MTNHELFCDLYRAYKGAARHKRSTFDEYSFEMYLFENLRQLTMAISTRNYQPGSSLVFINQKPVVREIFAAPFPDRVAQHLIVDYTADFNDRQLIYDSYSCRKDKGTDVAIKRLYQMVRKASDNFTQEVWVFKGDLKNYFNTLIRAEILKSALRMLDRQYERGEIDKKRRYIAEFLWAKTLLDNPCINAHRRGSIKDWDLLPKHKSLFNQPPGRGIAIGNITSQWISNIYLNDFDQFVTKHLNYKLYGRYVDDFFVILRPEQLKQFSKDLAVMEDYLKSMGLTLHPNKRSLQPFKRGVRWLGVIVRPHRILPDQRIIKNFRTKALQVAQTGSEADIVGLVSYLGRLKGYNARQLEQKIFDDLGWESNYSEYPLMVNDGKLPRH